MEKFYNFAAGITIFADIDENQHIKKIYGFSEQEIDPYTDVSEILSNGLAHISNFYDEDEPEFYKIFALRFDGIKDIIVFCDTFQRNIQPKTEILGFYSGDDTAIDIADFIKSERPGLWPHVKDDLIYQLIGEHQEKFFHDMCTLLDNE